MMEKLNRQIVFDQVLNVLSVWNETESIMVKLDKNDLKLMFDAICYFDMDHSGTGYYTDALNDSFHYLYCISRKVGFDDI